LSQLQGRTDPSAVISNIDAIRERLVDGGESEASAYSILRDIVVQSLMEIGARSFSHFLNAIERYIKLMRHITEDPEARTEIFEAAGKFWGKNTQMLYITVDKLLQYQFAEPTDLIKWTFKRHGGFIDLDSWLLIRSALDKAKGRVVVAEKKVAQLRKEHEDQVAAQKAQSTTNMDVEDAADTGLALQVFHRLSDN
jgi:nuclear cap-binding protein subunit 1